MDECYDNEYCLVMRVHIIEAFVRIYNMYTYIFFIYKGLKKKLFFVIGERAGKTRPSAS